jgi:hypothetical protein
MLSLLVVLAACAYKAEMPVAEAPAAEASADAGRIAVSGTERFNIDVRPQTAACRAHVYHVAFAPYAQSAIRGAFAKSFGGDADAASKLAVNVDDVSLRLRCIPMSYSAQCLAESEVTLVAQLTPASGAPIERRVTREASGESSMGLGCERGVEAMQAAVRDAISSGASHLAEQLRAAAH